MLGLLKGRSWFEARCGPNCPCENGWMLKTSRFAIPFLCLPHTQFHCLSLPLPLSLSLFHGKLSNKHINEIPKVVPTLFPDFFNTCSSQLPSSKMANSA
ncbi:hypothetical protein V6N12_021094, partial [Hibiscus sabdariffa]